MNKPRATTARADALRRFLAGWVDAAGRAALAVVLLAAAAAGGALYYTATHLGFDTDTNRMLSDELPFRRVYQQYRESFPQFTDNILLVVDGETPDLAADAAAALAERLPKETGLFKAVYLPGGFFEARGLLYLSLPELEDLADNLARVQPFLGRLTRDPTLAGFFGMLEAAVEAVQDGEELDLTPLFERVAAGLNAAFDEQPYRLSWQELILGRPLRVEDRRRFVLLQPRLDYAELMPAEPAMQALRRLITEPQFTPEHGVRVRITGEAALAYEELQTVSRGAGVAAILALVMVGIVLGFGLRSWKLVLATLATLLVGLVLTAGFAAAAVGHLNLISVAFAVLYIGLGVDYAIHFCLRYQELRGEGVGHREALRGTAADVGDSLLLCSVTTAVGFYAFVPTAFAGVSELGLIAGTGMFIGLVVTLSLLPALLILLKPGAPAAPVKGFSGQAWLVRLPNNHPRAVTRGAVALGLIALVLLSQVRFDFNPIHLRDPDTESVATFNELLAESTTSPWSISIMAASAEEARALAARLRSLDEVAETRTLADFVPENQDEKLAILEDLGFVLGPELGLSEPRPEAVDPERSIRAMRELLATLEGGELQAALQRFLGALATHRPAGQRELLERLDASLLGTLPARLAELKAALAVEPVTPEDLPEDLVERWLSADGRHRVQAFPRETLDNNADLRRFVAAVQTVAPQATDEAVIVLEAGRTVVRAFIEAFCYALAAITVLLLFLLSPRRDVLRVLGPLLLAGALTGAAAVVLDLPFNFANVIALPLLLGIGVDSGIHMVHRYRAAPPGSGNLLATSTARAVLVSALTTVCSFGNLALSPHPGTASMGLLLTVGVGFTLLCTLVVLPALLQRRRVT